MLAAAARMARGVEVPVTVDAEAGDGMQPGELVAARPDAGAAGGNLEDTDHTACGLRDPNRHAEWLPGGTPGRVGGRLPARDQRPGRRLPRFLPRRRWPGTQEGLVPQALRRANAYLEAGVDCVYPIVLWETDALRRFTSEVRGPVNVARLPQLPSLAELAAAGVARVSWGPFLHLDAMARFSEQLASLQQ